jgi:hypothetical protein
LNIIFSTIKQNLKIFEKNLSANNINKKVKMDSARSFSRSSLSQQRRVSLNQTAKMTYFVDLTHTGG